MRKTSFWVKILVPFFSVVICVMALEIAGRIWENNLAQGPTGWEMVGTRRIQYDFHTHYYRLRPNEDYFWEGIPVHINGQGLREADRDYQKAPNTYRVLVLGDSVPFGWEVQQANSHVQIVENLLRQRTDRRYDVVNMGTPGLNLAREYYYLKDTMSLYQPDLVVWDITTWNDIDPRECAIIDPPPSDSSVFRWMRDNTALWPFLSSLMGTLREPRPASADSGDGANAYPFPVDIHDAYWQTCVHQPLQQMVDLLAPQHIPLLLVVFPIDMQVRNPDAVTTPQDYFQQIKLEIPSLRVLDLLPAFRDAYATVPKTTEADSINPLFADYYSHPSPIGHKMAGETIYSVIMEMVR